jgi:glutamate formiminotransferase / formiminotetrahydrofolate cyclodeaminase
MTCIPLKSEEKIIEYVLAGKEKNKLTDMSLSGFADETSSESPAPGGGSVSAAMGAMGVALGTMVANLSSHKRGWDDRWEEFSDWAEKGREIQDELIFLVDEDTNAFNGIMSAFSMSKKSDEEIRLRNEAIQDATKYAIEVPFRIMETAHKALSLIKAMVEQGNPNSVTDAGVGALAIRSCVMGAFLNVRVNAGDSKTVNLLKTLYPELK